MPPGSKTLIEQLLSGDFAAFMSGLAGGAVTLVREVKENCPVSLRRVVCSLFISGATAWILHLVLPKDMAEDARTFTLVVAGMLGERLLAVFEKRFLNKVLPPDSTGE